MGFKASDKFMYFITTLDNSKVMCKQVHCLVKLWESEPHYNLLRFYSRICIEKDLICD